MLLNYIIEFSANWNNMVLANVGSFKHEPVLKKRGHIQQLNTI